MRRLVLSAGLLCAAACGGNDPMNPGGGGGVASVTAKIDGVDWSSEFTVSAENPSPGLYGFTAVRTTGSSNYTLGLALRNIGGPGTYPLGVTDQLFGGDAYLLRSGSTWSTPHTGMAGQAVITALSPTRISGTFEFVATPGTGSLVNKSVTEGVFDIPVTGAGGIAAANQGSAFSATIGGASFAPFHAGSAMFADTLRFGATDPVYTIIIHVANMTGVGTYAMSDSTPGSAIAVLSPPGTPTMSWRSDAAGGSGSVDVATATSGRVTGTFTATVIGVTNASGPLTLIGSFSMGGYFAD